VFFIEGWMYVGLVLFRRDWIYFTDEIYVGLLLFRRDWIYFTDEIVFLVTGETTDGDGSALSIVVGDG
jgi:hypothetical protein